MKPPEKALVCARANDRWVVYGSSFDRFCSRCKTRVMVAPSGVRMLESDPSIVVLCIPCAAVDAKTIQAAGKELEVENAASPTELADELRNTHPNFWNKRN